MMNKLFLTAAALGALAAAPAAAQYGYQNQGNYQTGYQNQGYGYQGGYEGDGQAGANLQTRIARLDTRFRAGVQSGLIDAREARSLRPQIRQLQQLERQYSLNGLSQAERQDLQQRFRTLRQQLRLADGGAGGRYAAWDNEERYDDRYATNDGYSSRGGYDDRYAGNGGSYGQGDAYGRGGYYGQGGPYEEVNQVCGARTGIGGVLGAILGGGDNCLTVGERVSGGLGAVPSQYQGQFRDGGGYYHRYVNGSVVQIDARSGTVVRIFDVRD